MSNRWPGGVIRKTPVTPTGPFQNGAASGVWSLADAAYWTKQGLWPIAGNFLAVEDVFSTWLYTGTGAAQTITNGINLSGSGGMVWAKARSSAFGHAVFDTVRGSSSGNSRRLITNSTAAAQAANEDWLSFNSNGFTANADPGGGIITANGTTFASWTFREAPNFFDVVTYTGNGVAGRQIAHNLGSTPGMILFKATSDTGSWLVWHRYDGTKYLELNSTNAAQTATVSIPTSSVFTIEAAANGNWNTNGTSYVAYLFGQDTSSTGLIQCGSLTTDAGSGIGTANLGWEPQWVLLKRTDASANWVTFDTMRGWSESNDARLFPNTSGAEDASFNLGSPNATGFTVQGLGAGATIAYVAIRRGPMRTPTLGTSVFLPLATSLEVDTAITTNFPVDLMISGQRNSNNATDNWAFIDRLRGATASNNTSSTPQKRIKSTSTNLEDSPTYPYAYNWWNTGLVQGYGLAGASQIYYTLRRAPGFFDEVCYTGTGVATAYNHNLGVVPELIIIKNRGANGAWLTYCAQLAPPNDKYLLLNLNNAPSTVAGTWKTPTSTTFGMDISFNEINASGNTYVAYLFASCAGVSKVGSYTGTGALQTINCAFTTGARFVLIKRTDSTGDWYVWDSARGISSGTDPYLLLNDVSAEITGTNYVDTDTTGFKVTAAAPAGINASGGSYIFLAIA
jgi:hypothetical protein